VNKVFEGSETAPKHIQPGFPEETLLRGIGREINLRKHRASLALRKRSKKRRQNDGVKERVGSGQGEVVHATDSKKTKQKSQKDS